MKSWSYILCFYLLVLMGLPTVRALKMQFGTPCEQTTCESDSSCDKNSSNGCEKGKFVMSLNFSPVQFVGTQDLSSILFSLDVVRDKKQTSYYEKIFISKYQQSIWHPPKLVS